MIHPIILCGGFGTRLWPLSKKTYPKQFIKVLGNELSLLQLTVSRFLGEEPGIDVIYKKDVMVNEFSGEAKEFVDVEKIQIVFTDTDNKFKKLEFVVGQKI